ncbi:putative Rho-type GTPase-activating protein 2 [Paramyrothecium foliicola]|nr:putative Rho-type GTPase-activating protein 2 [Paramyrothecium foliicola]
MRRFPKMGRKPAPQPLMLAGSNASDHDSDPPAISSAETPRSIVSPATSNTKSPRSPRSPPLSARLAPQKSPDRSQQHLRRPSLPHHDAHDADAQQNYPSITAALEPRSGPSADITQTHPPPNDTTAARKPTKTGFFHFSKASKSSNHLVDTTQSSHQEPGPTSTSASTNESDDSPTVKKGDHPAPAAAEQPPLKLATSASSRTDVSQSSAGDREPAVTPSSAKKTKPKPFGILGRTKSMRDKERDRERERDNGSPSEAHLPMPASTATSDLHATSAPPRTAPVAQDRSFREMMGSTYRNRSEDRAPSREGSRDISHRDRDHKAQPSSLKENGGGSTFLSGLRDSSTRAAGILSKGFFGRSTRISPAAEREPVIDDEHYVLKVINLPLVEQTRLTRISKRLEQSRDKTEFWMPAFPWRAIDYLNYKGCDVEGLYRVPGSGPQVKKWQRKFDELHDVNLFEEDDLYDINIIGSMLKAWLRELPDELFPKEAQERIARECAGAEKVPQLLIDELSNLSPFNYYLLFAITCHLSLLLAHSDKNKMDFRNLCICFQPCMKIDAFCFKFLVCEWRDCWQGCKNEAKFIEEEYTLFAQPPPRGLTEPQQPHQTTKSGSREQSREPSTDGKRQDQASPVENTVQVGSARQTDRPKQSDSGNDAKVTPKKKPAALLDSSTIAGSKKSSGTSKYGFNGDREVPDSLRPLSPIKPLSPLGL